MTKYIIATKSAKWLRDHSKVDLVPVPTEIISNISGITITGQIPAMPNIIFVETNDTLEELRAKVGDNYNVETINEYKVL